MTSFHVNCCYSRGQPRAPFNYVLYNGGLLVVALVFFATKRAHPYPVSPHAPTPFNQRDRFVWPQADPAVVDADAYVVCT